MDSNAARKFTLSTAMTDSRQNKPKPPRRPAPGTSKPGGVTKPRGRTGPKPAAGGRGSGAQASKPSALAAPVAVEETVGEASISYRGMFSQDLRVMMYGFGDEACPLQQTVDLVEDIVIEYVTCMAHRAGAHAALKGKVGVEDILYLVRKDQRKWARIKELLEMQAVIKEARKAFEEEDLEGKE